ncbi:MAG: septal ring lytic transglycosylase RlpA family protein [Stellaceae bacterium]
MSYKPLIAGIFACSLAASLVGPATSQLDAEPGATSVNVPLPPPLPSVKAAALQSCHDPHKLRMGVASWYGGPMFHQTANGEKFQPDALAAASRTLPFNTHVRVTNLRNGRSVVVRINDRGPYVRGRTIDLTPEAAAKLHMVRNGLAPVYIEIVRNDTAVAAR